MKPNCGLALPCLDKTFARVWIRSLLALDPLDTFCLAQDDRQRVGLYGKLW